MTAHAVTMREVVRGDDGELYAVIENSWLAKPDRTPDRTPDQEPDQDAIDREQLELEHSRRERQERERLAAIDAEIQAQADELRW